MYPFKFRRYLLALLTGTFLGAIAGYFAGFSINFILNGSHAGYKVFIPGNLPRLFDKINDISLFFDKWGYGILFAAVFTPIPYNLFSVFAGFVSLNFIIFIISAVLGHGVKYTLIYLALRYAGPHIQKLLATNVRPVLIIACISFLLLIVLAFMTL